MVGGFPHAVWFSSLFGPFIFLSNKLCSGFKNGNDANAIFHVHHRIGVDGLPSVWKTIQSWI
ncbi:hypothetical protein I4U23_031097 [Adineta vaga]|nr:hypothetical protein I4U23_031097 [Adineta vaga]